MDVKALQLPVDPTLVPLQQQAQTDLVNAMTPKTQGDMATLMARYGTQLALSARSGGATPMPLAR